MNEVPDVSYKPIVVSCMWRTNLMKLLSCTEQPVFAHVDVNCSCPALRTLPTLKCGRGLNKSTVQKGKVRKGVDWMVILLSITAPTFKESANKN